MLSWLNHITEKKRIYFILSLNNQANPFVFNEKFDTAFIHSLYEDDLAYIAEIFSITATQLEEDIPLAKAAFSGDDLTLLKQRVHKLKPSFGFVGLTALQENCRIFEDRCKEVSDKALLTQEFNTLTARLDEALELVKQEMDRLNKYNQQ